MKLATRITAGNLTLVAILLGLAGYFLRGLEELRGPLIETTGSLPEVASSARALDAQLVSLIDFLQKSTLYPSNSDYETRAEALRLDIEARIRDLRLPEAGSGLDSAKLERTVINLEWERKKVKDAWRAFEKAIPLPELALDEQAAEAAIDAFAARLAEAAEPIRVALGVIATEADELARTEPQYRLDRARRRAARTSFWAAAVALVLALTVALGVLGAATRPLERLARGARAIASGDLSFRVTPQGSPEVRGLARDFNAMADRLHELNRLKSDFVSSVSHDLKAPLASIAETTSLLLDGLPGPLTEKQSRLLALNLESSRRLGQMIENLLDLSRIETGALALQFLRHDLVVLAGQVVDQLRGLIDKKGLAVAIEGAAGTAIVECDAASIRRALGNLVANAVTFSPAGGRIDIRVQPRAKESVEVLVADQGPGVPDAEKERIFQRFYRSEHGARGPGTGIGLAIARAVLEAHGGVLWVRDGPSGGSVFSCLLPRTRRGPREALA